MKLQVTVEGQVFDIEINDLSTRPIIAYVNGEPFEVMPEETLSVAVSVPQPVLTPARPAAPPVAKSAPVPSKNGSSANAVYAPIPGVINSLDVKPGDAVTPGQQLCVLEAMKMKNVIRANRAGKIAEIYVSVGQQVRHHDALMAYAD